MRDIILVSGFLALVACTSAATPSGSSSDKQRGTDTPKTDKASDDGEGENKSPPANAEKTKECAAKADDVSCRDCCDKAFPEYMEAVSKSDAELTACECQPTACGNECAKSYCKDPPGEFDAACEECLVSKKARACQDADFAAWEKFEQTPIFKTVKECHDTLCKDKPEPEFED